MLTKSLYEKKVQRYRWRMIWAMFAMHMVFLAVGLYLEWPDKLLLTVSIVLLAIICEMATIAPKTPVRQVKQTPDLKESIPVFTEPVVLNAVRDMMDELVALNPNVQLSPLLRGDPQVISGTYLAEALLYNRIECLYQPVVNLQTRKLSAAICQAYIKLESGQYMDLDQAKIENTAMLQKFNFAVTIRKLQNIRKAATIRKKLHFICEVPDNIANDSEIMARVTEFLLCQFFPLKNLVIKVSTKVKIDELPANSVIAKLRAAGVRVIREQPSYFNMPPGSHADMLYYDWSNTTDHFSITAKRERNAIKSLQPSGLEIMVVNIDNEQDFLEVHPTVFKHACGRAFGLPKSIEDIYG